MSTVPLYEVMMWLFCCGFSLVAFSLVIMFQAVEILPLLWETICSVV